MDGHDCLEHLTYEQDEWIEPHGEHCSSERWRCTICGSWFTGRELDKLSEANAQ